MAVLQVVDSWVTCTNKSMKHNHARLFDAQAGKSPELDPFVRQERQTRLHP